MRRRRESLEVRTQLFAQFLEANGLDITEEHLERTPERFAKWFAEQMAVPSFNFTTFTSKDYDQLIAIAPIPFYTLCAHHLLPFFGQAYVAYLPSPKGGVAGLSKFARTVRAMARGVNIQEDLTKRIARYLNRRLHPRYLAVVTRAEHFCMTMRGAQSPGTLTTCSAILPVQMQAHESLKAEAFRMWGLP